MHELDATDGAVEKALDNVEKKFRIQHIPQYTQCIKNGIQSLSLETDIKDAGGRLKPLVFPKWMEELLAHMRSDRKSRYAFIHFLVNAMNLVVNVHNCLHPHNRHY